jgi:hypothetical protein
MNLIGHDGRTDAQTTLSIPAVDVKSGLANLTITISVFSRFFGKMKIWLPRFFFGWFLGNTNFLQSKVGKTENIVISERAYTILKIMSIQGYKMWTNELST